MLSSMMSRHPMLGGGFGGGFGGMLDFPTGGNVRSYSYSSSSRGNLGDNGETRWVSERRMQRTINGVTETVHEKRDNQVCQTFRLSSHFEVGGLLTRYGRVTSIFVKPILTAVNNIPSTASNKTPKTRIVASKMALHLQEHSLLPLLLSPRLFPSAQAARGTKKSPPAVEREMKWKLRSHMSHLPLQAARALGNIGIR